MRVCVCKEGKIGKEERKDGGKVERERERFLITRHVDRVRHCLDFTSRTILPPINLGASVLATWSPCQRVRSPFFFFVETPRKEKKRESKEYLRLKE
jgi:hypothetical protein